MGQGSAVSTKLMERTVLTATLEMSSCTGGFWLRRLVMCFVLVCRIS